jgi:hypothetical protein
MPARVRPRAASSVLALAAVLAPLAVASPADAAATRFTVVDHGTTFTEFFPDDICGDRASTTTFVRTVEQVHLTRMPDGGFSYHDVTVFTYHADYVDPTLPDLDGRGTEVNSFVLTPGDNTFINTVAYHDFFGDVRIHERAHLTELRDGTVVVDREILDVTGCP